MVSLLHRATIKNRICAASIIHKVLPALYSNMIYSERLTKLDVDSLELRRLHLDLICAYKIMFGLVETHVAIFLRRLLLLLPRGGVT